MYSHRNCLFVGCLLALSACSSGGNANPGSPDDRNPPPNFIDIVAGHESTCVLSSTGAVKCRGTYYPTADDTPVTVSDLTAAAIAGGFAHDCALLAGGAVLCWAGSAKATVPDLTASAIAAGSGQSCAILKNNKVTCWKVKVDDFTTPTSVEISEVSPIDVSGASAVAAGEAHACALLNSGKVMCWGSNQFGAVGNGSEDNTDDPVEVTKLPRAAAIAATTFHTCALLKDGTVMCWGNDSSGQLGDGASGSGVHSHEPVEVKNLSDVVAIAAGETHTCAVLKNTEVRCWGDNAYGQLGDGTRENRPTPVKVSELTNVYTVATGLFHSCALLNDGTVKCWGANFDETLGKNPPETNPTPVPVAF